MSAVFDHVTFLLVSAKLAPPVSKAILITFEFLIVPIWIFAEYILKHILC